jgi:hypothetical protein
VKWAWLTSILAVRSTWGRSALRPVQSAVQKDRLPEVTHHRRVYREVHPGDVDEDRPEKLAGDRAPVELGH